MAPPAIAVSDATVHPPHSKSAQHLLGKPAQPAQPAQGLGKPVQRTAAAALASDPLSDVTVFAAALQKREELVAAGQPITANSVLLAAVARAA